MKLLTLGLIFAYAAAGPAQIKPREGLNEIESLKGYGKALDEKLLQSLKEWDPLKDNGKRIIRLIELGVSKSKINLIDD